MRLKQYIPWWLKIILKLMLVRLPFSYSAWHKLGIFQHGEMDKVEYVQRNFHEYFVTAGLRPEDMSGETLLELGPGDSVATALIASSYGIKTILLDAGDFAIKDLSVYRALAQNLSLRGYRVPSLDGAKSFQDVLEICSATYLTNGLTDIRKIASASANMIVSQAVLEHVLRSEIREMMAECKRVLNPHGTCIHVVDLKDHLSRSLNNLRFSEVVWESEFFAGSGFYTNRIQMHEMSEIFHHAGFTTKIARYETWGDSLPISKRSLATPFSSMTDEQLNISEFTAVLTPAETPI